MRSVLDCAGSDAVLVDKLIGNSYQVVRYVATQIEYVKHVSAHMAEVYRVAQSGDAIDKLFEKIEVIDDVFSKLSEIETINESLTEISALVPVVDEIVALFAHIEHLETIGANLDSILLAIDGANSVITARIADETTSDTDDEKLSTPVDVVRRVKEQIDSRLAPSRLTAISSNLLSAPPNIRLEGYHNPGDGGGGLYKLVGGNPGHTASFSITLKGGDTAWYELVFGSTITPEQFGAKRFVDDTEPGNDTAAIASLTQYAPIGSEVYLARSYNVTSFQNHGALKFVGPGEIVILTPAGSPSLEEGYARLNWAKDADRDVFGEEYFYPIRKKLASTTLADRNCAGFFYGDSTFANPSGVLTNVRNFPEHAFPIISGELGLPGRLFGTNEAVAGTTFAQCFAGSTKSGNTPIENLGPGVTFSVFKFLLNEGSASAEGRPASLFEQAAATVQALRDGWAAMRAHEHGTINTHAIICIGPNSANNIGYQDQRWLKVILPLLRQVCREYHVVYIDLHDRWPDSYVGAYRWLDGPYFPGTETPSYGPLHPLDLGWAMIWAAVKDVLRVGLLTSNGQTNGFQNLPDHMHVMPANAPPSIYHPGAEWYEVTDDPAVHPDPAARWPGPGMLESRVSGGGKIKTQMLHVKWDSRILTRRQKVGLDEWGPWTGSFVSMGLINGWTNYGAFHPEAGAFRSTDGQIAVQGFVTPGTATPGTNIAELPAGMAPTTIRRFVCATSGSDLVVITATLDGHLQLESGTPVGWVSLDGVSFYP